MALNLPQVPFKLTPQDMGGFDLGAAIRQGFGVNKDFQEAKIMPQRLSEKLLDMHLQNKINSVKAKHQESLINAQINEHRQNIASKIFQQNLLRDALSAAGMGGGSPIMQEDPNQDYTPSVSGRSQTSPDNSEYNVSAEGPGIAASTSAYDTFPGRRKAQPGAFDMAPKGINPIYAGLLKKQFGIDFNARTPEQKAESEINVAQKKEQYKIDAKHVEQLKEAAKDLSLAGIDVEGIHDILTGTDSLGTGILKTLTGKLGFGSEKLGQFNERALRLQTQMTKALSSRGGVGAAKIVQSGKPSTWKSTSENLGITNAYADRIKNEFNLLNKEYKSITGADLPYTLPEYVKNMGHKINEKMFKPKTEFTSEKDYHDYMRSLNPEQKKIALKALRGVSK